MPKYTIEVEMGLEPADMQRHAEFVLGSTAVVTPVAPQYDETTILVAFVVEHLTNQTPQQVHEELQSCLAPLLKSQDELSPVLSWWIAEDVRFDGSDNDSAVFVTPGSAHQAGITLHALGLTEKYNIPDDACNGQFEQETR